MTIALVQVTFAEAEEAERVGQQLIEERLSVLDKHQFERMLRGIFEEDEVILVLIGGVLGGAVGALQGAIVLTAGW